MLVLKEKVVNAATFLAPAKDSQLVQALTVLPKRTLRGRARSSYRKTSTPPELVGSRQHNRRYVHPAGITVQVLQKYIYQASASLGVNSITFQPAYRLLCSGDR
jgi:hypothetical protein